MKTYKFAVSNWKNPVWSGFWVYKRFRSAYEADRWAMRNTFGKSYSMYNIVFMAGEETD